MNWEEYSKEKRGKHSIMPQLFDRDLHPIPPYLSSASQNATRAAQKWHFVPRCAVLLLKRRSCCTRAALADTHKAHMQLWDALVAPARPQRSPCSLRYALRRAQCKTQHPLPLWASLPQLCWRLHPQPQAAFPARTAGERGDPWHGDDSQSTLPVFRTRLSAVLSPSDIFVCLSKNWDCKGKRIKAWQKALCNEAQHSGGEVKHFGCPIVIWFSMTKNKKQKTSKLKAASFPFSVNTFPFVIQQISAFPTPIP